jgi:putative ABC transport system permease protein
MLTNYLKIAWRNLRKHKIFSLVNIAGLSIGLSSFLLITLYVLDETGYDHYTRNADRVYRINSDLRFGGSDLHIPVTSDMMGQLLKKDYPQVEQYTRIYVSNGNKLIKKGNSYINEKLVAHVDSTFFDIFTLPSIEGNTSTALNEPSTVVLSETAAQKYFGTVHALGKTIETNDKGSTLYKVTAVIKDIPKESHFQFDFMFSMKNVDYQWGQLTSHNFHTYLRLTKGTDPTAFEKKFEEYTVKYVLPYAQQFIKVSSMDEFRKAGNRLDYSLIPISKIHLYSDRTFEITPSGNIQYVYIFSAIALFILLIACVNFMNLTTARSANRAREVGIRKVLGTEKKDLIAQFLIESVLMVGCALIIALLLTWLVLPLFNNLANKTIAIKNLLSPSLIIGLLLLPVIVGIIAGSYPAFFLSSFRPIEVLKGKLKLGSRSGGLRSVLVVFQFTTSIILIVGTIVIYRQLNYIQSKDLGFNKNQVLIINDAYALKDNIDAFKQNVLQMSGVTSATISSFLPVSSSSRSDNTYFKDPVMDSKSGLDMQAWHIDYDYIPTMGMQIIKGRNFSKEFGSDSAAIIINESTVKILQFDNPIGKKIYTTDDNNKPIFYTVIGVVKNFNYESLRENVGPLSFFLGKRPGLISFRINTGQVMNLEKQIENKWKAMAPGMPFSYRFLDQSFDEMYRSEQRVGTVAMVFAVIAILIACLGLFGLATFIAEQRTKEISIRKVLGASVQGIIRLLSKDFVRLVLISVFIATPFAWWIMNKWLNDFAYRTNISWWIFAAAGFVAIFIALATVSFQAIRAAIANPAKNLRTE